MYKKTEHYMVGIIFRKNIGKLQQAINDYKHTKKRPFHRFISTFGQNPHKKMKKNNVRKVFTERRILFDFILPKTVLVNKK